LDPAYAFSGFAVGTIVGLTGVGGGSLMTPLLILLFGVSPVTAIGTDLIYAAITKAGGAAVHANRGNVDWNIVARLATGSVTGAVLTLAVLSLAPVDRAMLAPALTACLGTALILTAAVLLGKERLLRHAHASNAAWRMRWATPLTLMVGFTLGVLVTLSSVGAGALGVAALTFLHPRLSAVRIVASDIAHAVPLTLVAGLGYAQLGTVDWVLLGSLLTGSLPGVWLGSTFSARVPERILRSVLASLLCLIGIRFVF
jgi:uncharacterized membrane protein YfcA